MALSSSTSGSVEESDIVKCEIEKKSGGWKVNAQYKVGTELKWIGVELTTTETNALDTAWAILTTKVQAAITAAEGL
jgi:hypothetical protein